MKFQNGKTTILVVDDEPLILEIVAVVLRKAGFDVLCAESAASAIALCQSQEVISIALLDSILPDQNGADLICCLRELHPKLRIVMMSGYTEAEIRDRGNPLESFSFVQKPFTPHSLIRAIQSAIGTEKARSAI